MASAILSNRVDYVRATDPVTKRKAAETPGMSAATYYQSVVHATWVNNKKKPLDDPRVRRAIRHPQGRAYKTARLSAGLNSGN